MGTGGSGAPTAKWEAHPQKPGGEIDLEKCGAKLLVRRPNVPEVEIRIEKNGFLIGRLAAEVDLVLDDDLVSRKHAVLSVNEQGYFRLEDCGSKNGITYEGRMVRRLNLLDGDVFSIGKTEFTFHANIERYAPPPESNEPPPPEDSVMVDVNVPLPRHEPEPSRVEPIGWDPARAQRESRPPDPAEVPHEEIDDEEAEAEGDPDDEA